MKPQWWVFVMKSGVVEKFYGTELREQADTFQVYNERLMTGFVQKNEVMNRWAQEQKPTDPENGPSPH